MKNFPGKLKSGSGKFRRSLKGFTLVETLVAISLITVVFVSVMGLANFILANISYTHEYLVASYLAAEGVEMVIQKRDNNWLNQRGFNFGLPISEYRVDYLGAFDNVSVSQPVLFDRALGYQYSQGTPTKFSRIISISYPQTYIMRVQARVDWTNRGNPYSILVEDNIFDWFSVQTQ